eukprot:1596555-Prymnesium_polylepis.1
MTSHDEYGLGRAQPSILLRADLTCHHHSRRLSTSPLRSCCSLSLSLASLSRAAPSCSRRFTYREVLPRVLSFVRRYEGRKEGRKEGMKASEICAPGALSRASRRHASDTQDVATDADRDGHAGGMIGTVLQHVECRP